MADPVVTQNRFPGLQRWPISYTQALLSFIEAQWPGGGLGPRYTMTVTETLEGPFSEGALERALETILTRHEVLRTALLVEEGDPCQVVVPPGDLPLTHTDLTRVPAAVRRAAVARAVAELGRRPISVDRPPLIRFDHLSAGDGEEILVTTAHHCAYDFWSARLFGYELSNLYQAFSTGQQASLPVLPIQYVDYAVWQRELMETGAAEASLRYWAEQLRGLPATRLPLDHPRPATPSGAGRHVGLQVPDALARRLQEVAAGEGASSFMLLMAVLSVLLAAVTGQEDVAVPTWFTGRTRPELEGLIGNFDDVVLVRSTIRPQQTLRAVIRAVRETMVTAYERQVPIVRIIETRPDLLALLAVPDNVWIAFHRQAIPRPLQRAARHLQEHVGDVGGPLRGVLAEGEDYEEFFAGADLDIRVREGSGGLLVEAMYSPDLFERATMEQLMLRFGRALSRVPSALDAPVAGLAD
jgi:Condensation domain